MPMCHTRSEGNRDGRKGVKSVVKYWAYFTAKIALAGVFLWAALKLILHFAPKPATFMYVQPKNPFAFDLGFTFLMLLYWLLAAGIIWIVIWDQRYRCRTCLRRLRMPIRKGSWTHVLLGAPRMEYICIYGHGTLKVAELQITGHQTPDWEPHEDIWKELFSESKR
jgi:hypothetical protein